MNIMQTLEELHIQFGRAKHACTHDSHFPNATYEQGVYDTLLWLFGDKPEPLNTEPESWPK